VIILIDTLALFERMLEVLRDLRIALLALSLQCRMLINADR
jgi:hypothetical protein